ncbi:MAG: tetratricopeptide repeat protein, partial [Planctomycetota bacterium]
MNRRAAHFGALLLMTTLAACGPTKTGIEAREQARERLDIVNAQMTFDQAERAFEAGRFERALDSLEEAIARYEENPEAHVLHGRIYLETHRLGKAYDAFTRAAELDEEMAEPIYFLAIIEQRRSNLEEARDLYMQASELDDQNVQYVLAAAECLVNMERHEEATDLLMGSLEQFEHNAAMHHLLGQIALLQGELDLAVSRYSQARM